MPTNAATHRLLNWAKAVLVIGLLTVAAPGWASMQDSQDNYERSIDAVVRHKEFYKADHLEVGLVAGAMPYDSIINHYMLGGRLTYHFADHYGWEIADLQYAFPSVSSYTNGLVTTSGISNLQTQELKFMVASNFVVSPLYGKIRLWGAEVLHFDTYLLAGVGAARNNVVMFGTTAVNQPVQMSTLASNFDPMFDFGLGFKLFLNHEIAFLFDLRDYVINETQYGNKVLKSNYSVYLGVSFFLPQLG